MANPDYLSKLRIVAEDHIIHEEPDIGPRLKAAWYDLEENAKALNYDVFEDRRELRASMSTMLRLLYEATPEPSVQADEMMILAKNAEYGASWCRRGGIGAFFMLTRKWDRLENTMQHYGSMRRALKNDQRPEGVLDDLGDLRRYLILVLAWHYAVKNPPEQRTLPFSTTVVSEPEF